MPRPKNRLRLQELETRTNPALLEVLSQSVSGTIAVSSTWGTGWSTSNSLSSHSTFLDVEYDDDNDSIASAYQQSIFGHGGVDLGYLSEVAAVHAVGSGNIDFQATFRLNPEAHEETGSPQPVLLSGYLFESGATYDGLVSLVGPGINFVQSSSFEADREPFLAEIGATYTLIVQVAGSSTPVIPGFETAASLSLKVVPGVTVAALYDDAGEPDDGLFGRFISGVKLQNTFTIDSPDPQVTGFRLTVEGVPNATFTKGKASGGTPFTFDVGLLPAAAGGGDIDYVVRVEAMGSGNVVRYRAAGLIQVIGRVGLDLLVKAAEDDGSPRPVEEARLIAGLSDGPSLEFHPTLTGVPDYYEGRLALSFYKSGSNKPSGQVAIDAITGGAGTTAATVPGEKFVDVQSRYDDFDYDIVVTAANKFRSGKSLLRLSEPEQLRVVKQPLWLKKNATGKGKGQYVADDAVAAQYGAGAAAYKFVVDTGKPFNLPLPKADNTPFDVFEKLKSGVELDANFSVYAPLFEDEGAKVVADRFLLNGTFLGEDVFEAELDPDTLAVTADLDDRTLDEPETVHIATAGAVDLLPLFGGDLSFERTFGPWKVDVPIFTVGAAGLDGTVLMKGEFAAAVTRLDVLGDVTFRFTESKIDRTRTTGDLELDLAAEATATLGASASVNVKVLGYKLIDLVSAQGTGSITFGLTAKVAGEFGGPKGITIDEERTRADVTLSYDFDYDISVLTEDPEDFTDIRHAEDDETGTIWPF